LFLSFEIFWYENGLSFGYEWGESYEDLKEWWTNEN